MRPLLILGAAMGTLLTGAALGAGQEPANVAAQRQAMKKLDNWVGQWKGTGWFRSADQKREFSISETVQSKLGGLALMVEGVGKAKNSKTGEEIITHNALAIVTYDAKSKSYRFSHYLNGAVPGDGVRELT